MTEISGYRKEQPTRGKRFSARLGTFFTYAALAVYAIMMPISTVQAAERDKCVLNQARIENLQKAAHGYFSLIRFAEDPYYAGDLAFRDAAGKTVHVSDYRGKSVLLNLWATWCGPCRKEMPELAKLHKDKGGSDFAVVAVNIDKGQSEKAMNYLKEVKADDLIFYRDSSMEIFNAIKRKGLAVGLPATLLLDEEGCLIASYAGSAPWANKDAKSLIDAVIASKKPAE